MHDTNNILVYPPWATNIHPFRAGLKYESTPKLNQDAFFVQEAEHDFRTLSLLGVFDGHGPVGERVSGMCIETLPLAVAKAIADGGLRPTPIARALVDVDRAIIKYRGFDSMFSGSTGVLVACQDGKILCANVGDSRCIVVSIDARGRLTAKPLSNEHSPEMPTEAHRIKTRGGRIDQAVFDGEKQGPLRIYKSDVDLPGLTVTRAFGDEMAKSVGVIAEPEIMMHDVGPQDRYLILCSDGCTEFLTDAEIANIVHAAMGQSGGNIMAALDTVITESRRRWVQEEGISDDCTILVGVIDPALALAKPPSRGNEKDVSGLKKGLMKMLALGRSNKNLETQKESEEDGTVDEPVPLTPTMQRSSRGLLLSKKTAPALNRSDLVRPSVTLFPHLARPTEPTRKAGSPAVSAVFQSSSQPGTSPVRRNSLGGRLGPPTTGVMSRMAPAPGPVSSPLTAHSGGGAGALPGPGAPSTSRLAVDEKSHGARMLYQQDRTDRGSSRSSTPTRQLQAPPPTLPGPITGVRRGSAPLLMAAAGSPQRSGLGARELLERSSKADTSPRDARASKLSGSGMGTLGTSRYRA